MTGEGGDDWHAMFDQPLVIHPKPPTKRPPVNRWNTLFPWAFVLVQLGFMFYTADAWSRGAIFDLFGLVLLWGCMTGILLACWFVFRKR